MYLKKHVGFKTCLITGIDMTNSKAITWMFIPMIKFCQI
jgi:hypothetical protein